MSGELTLEMLNAAFDAMRSRGHEVEIKVAIPNVYCSECGRERVTIASARTGMCEECAIEAAVELYRKGKLK